MGLFYDPCYEGIKRGIRGKDIMVIMTMAIIKMMMIWTRLGRWWFGAWVSALLRKGKKGNPANICSTFFLQLITRPFPSSSSYVGGPCSIHTFHFSSTEHGFMEKTDSVQHQCLKLWCYSSKSCYLTRQNGDIYELLISFDSDVHFFICSKLCCFYTLHRERRDWFKVDFASTELETSTGHTHSLSLWLREKRSTAAKEQSIFTSFSKSHSSRRPSCPKSEKSERRDWFQAGFAPMRH